MFHYVLASSGRRSDQYRRRFEHEVDVHLGDQGSLGGAGVPRQVEDRERIRYINVFAGHNLLKSEI